MLRIHETAISTNGPPAQADEDDALAGIKELVVRRFQFNGETQGWHVGPTAQDFARRFAIGDDAERIRDVDALGIMFLAIKALVRRVEELEAQAHAH